MKSGEREKERNLLVESLPDALAYHQIVTDSAGKPVDYIFHDVNRAFEEIFGLPKERVMGKRISEVFPNIRCSDFDWIGTFGKVALTGENLRFEYYYESTKCWYEITAYRSEPGYFAVIFRDISENKKGGNILSRVNDCLLGLGSDFLNNIDKIVALCGELLGGACAIYNRLDKRMLCVWGSWQLPADFQKQDQPEGHLCFDLIKQVSGDILYIPDLLQTNYAETDPNVRKYALKSYLGHLVRLGKEPVGSLCVVFQHRYILTESDRNLLGIMAAAIETEERRRQAEELLRESEERFRIILDNLPGGVFAHDLDGQILFVNKMACENTGYSKEELLGMSVGDIDSGSMNRDERIQLWQNLALGDSTTFESSHTRKDGSQYSIELHLNAIRLQGKPVILPIVFNITDRKKAEEAMHRREQEFRALVENAPDIVARFDRNLRRLYINPAVEKHSGIPREELIGKTHAELNVSAEQAQLWNSTLLNVFRSGCEKEMYLDFSTPAGHKYCHSRIVPEFAPDGTVETVLCITRDITNIKKVEAALHQERVKTRRLHRRALPDDLPVMPGLALASHYRPAATLQGDYYNIVCRGKQLLVYLVDIQENRDDGVLQSLFVRNALAGRLSYLNEHTDLSPAVLLRHLVEQYEQESRNTEICPHIFMAVFDTRVAGSSFGKLRYASTGASAFPLFVCGAEPMELLMDGAYPHTENGTGITEHSFSVAPGTTFFFSTDGLFKQDFGETSYVPRFREVFMEHSHLPPELISRAVNADFNDFSNGSPPTNDIAYFVVQVPQWEQRLSFRVGSDFKLASDAEQKVASFLASHFEIRTDLLSFHELLINAMEHGNKRDGGKWVSVDITVTEKYYKIVITDQGEGFNWRNRINRELDLEGSSERGRGIIMTRMMTDYVGYNERGNSVTMINLLK